MNCENKMNLVDVCNWLTEQGYNEITSTMNSLHHLTSDGLISANIVKETCDESFGTTDLFRSMECCVTTYMFYNDTLKQV